MPRNNLIVLLLAAAGLFSSCGNGNHYSLTGNLPARYDGCLVKLTPATFYFSEEKTSPEDSVKIKNGKFQFNGAVQKPTVYMLTIDGVDYKIPDMASIAVVIEPGDITMEYDTLGIMVSGNAAPTKESIPSAHFTPSTSLIWLSISVFSFDVSPFFSNTICTLFMLKVS